MGKQWASKVCQECLSISNDCPESVQHLICFICQKVKIQAMSRYCPSASLSRVCPIWNFVFFKSFDWTMFGQMLDFLVQSLSKNLSLDRHLTGLGHRLDRPCILPAFGQAMDKAWTDLRQRLDFLSSLCPTKHWSGVPQSYISLDRHIEVASLDTLFDYI